MTVREFYTQIRDQLVNLNEGNHDHCHKFLPSNSPALSISKTEVEQILKSIPELKNRDIPTFAQHVTHHAMKVFLTLVRIGQVKQIEALQIAGFTDQDLPIRSGAEDRVYRVNETGQTTEELDGFQQEQPYIDHFVDAQWYFLAPKFRSDEFEYDFLSKCPLPFAPAPNENTHEGLSGVVYPLYLHTGHLEDKHKYSLRPFTNTAHIKVALKHFQMQSSFADVGKFYDREKKTLKLMKDLNHEHLVKAIAAFQRGHDKFFLFPWAQGGNLCDFWQTCKDRLDKDLVSWAVRQMRGISEGLRELHQGRGKGNSGGTRHGDLKPENILLFTTQGTGSRWGNLVVADVGLAKFHPDYTRERVGPTTNKYGSLLYSPPETPSGSKADKLSRKYDVWGLGCIFLQFVIWIIYGPKQLKEFVARFGNQTNFWTDDTDRGVPQKHPRVKETIDAILETDLKAQSPLHQLVQLIDEQLLVPAWEDRAEAKDVVAKLDKILESCSKKSYQFDSRLRDLAGKRSLSIGGATQPTQSISKQRMSEFVDEWENVTDKDRVLALMSYLDWPSLRPTIDASRICDSCRTVDFQSCSLDLGQQFQDWGNLESSSETCPICGFLFRRLSKLGHIPEGPLKLFPDDKSYAFKVSPGGPPIVSLYCDPVFAGQTPSYAQLGLPRLPEVASTQQFSLLKGWIETCDKTHNCITKQGDPNRKAYMPTMVIDVGKAGSASLCLVESEDTVKGNYIALSHRWGDLKPEQRFCTYHDNLANLKKEIPYDSLPKSFQDAVRVTRALGVSYLWIDSLCIIQERGEKWAEEASKMEDVFSGAYCTIAASSAESSLHGFLGKRTPRECVTVQTSQGPLYLAEAIDDFYSDVEQSVLNKRGWVLQERALSPRTIYFTSTQVYWECGEGVCCETLAQLRNPQSQFLGDSAFPSYGLHLYKDDSIRLVQRLYQQYSGLDLSEPRDRSKAILGLQARLSRSFNSKESYGVLWKYFERTLLWQAESSCRLSRISYSDDDVVPSWSWMAYMGKIAYMDISFAQVDWTPSIEDAGSNGLRAKASQFSTNDTTELWTRATLDSNEYPVDPVGWMYIVIGKSKKTTASGGRDLYGLLIRPHSSSTIPSTYKRVGVCTLSDAHILLGTEDVYLK
ncbi:hypothetical protein BKA56DRAFT_504371 [Ilyonectria sp. MPI-CAGE-AT-0026]|nr:hypothetical protein BKA56DRAFT_504371 [Ilyonectria sp. MPI-CAGE-AT-0026]